MVSFGKQIFALVDRRVVKFSCINSSHLIFLFCTVPSSTQIAILWDPGQYLYTLIKVTSNHTLRCSVSHSYLLLCHAPFKLHTHCDTNLTGELCSFCYSADY